LVESGSLFVEDLVISVLGVEVANLNGVIAANTGVAINVPGITGLSILLNEQVVTGDGITSRGITTNAIHVSFDGAVIANLGGLSGELIVAHTAASLGASPAAVPEPSSLALLTLTGAAVVFGRRFRRQTAD
ncbi:MAG: PEP-CTERM sorting domain-containing protein, partial [Planctomycetaceae bacterium]